MQDTVSYNCLLPSLIEVSVGAHAYPGVCSYCRSRTRTCNPAGLAFLEEWKEYVIFAFFPLLSLEGMLAPVFLPLQSSRVKNFVLELSTAARLFCPSSGIASAAQGWDSYQVPA